jgi:hypothetical protein
VDALRARPYSARAYFLLNGPSNIRQRAEGLVAHWQGWITRHPDVGDHNALGTRLAPALSPKALAFLALIMGNMSMCCAVGRAGTSIVPMAQTSEL